MKSEYMKDKDGNYYTNQKTGEYLITNTLEMGDEFVPLWNHVISETKSNVENNTLKVMLRDIQDGKNKEVFLNLTPAQANTLKRKTENGYDINQHKFITHLFTSKQGFTNPDREDDYFIGVGFEPSTPEPNTSLLDY